MIDKRIVYGYFAFIIILNVVGLFILPMDMVMQVNTSGEANWTLNKYIAIAFMFGLGVIGGLVALYTDRSNYRKYALMVIIVFVEVLMFVFNM